MNKQLIKEKLKDVRHILRNQLTKKTILENIGEYIDYDKCIQSINNILDKNDTYDEKLENHLNHFIKNTKDATKISVYHMELLNDMNYFIEFNEEKFKSEMLNKGNNQETKIDKSKNTWIISPGKDAGIWEECRYNNYIAIGWDKVNANDYNRKEQLKNILSSEYYLAENHRVANFLWYFAKEIQIGDIVIARKGRSKIIGIGEVMSDYIPPNDFNNPRKDKDFKQIRKVNWFDTSEYNIDKPFGINTVSKIHTNPQIKKILKESLNKYYNFIKPKAEKSKPKEVNNEKKQEFSNEEIKYDDFNYKNILLKGVPGTGKSRLLDIIIKRDLKLENHYESNVLRINIHSASSNADLMQGIAINSNDDGNIEYKEKQGLILELIEKATFNPNQPFVLVLEEIQENSLNELIGDLIYLIEDSKRAKGYKADNKKYTYGELINEIMKQNSNINSVKLPSLISKSEKTKRMIIPHNLFIFCTSNYRDDRKVIEDNLLRRFEVIEIYPKYKNEIKEFDNQKVSDFLKALNESIVKVLKSNGEIHPDRFMIGHSIWLKVKYRKDFLRAFLKVITEFKDVKEMHFDDFNKILKELEFPFKVKNEYKSYEEWIKFLQNECYDFLREVTLDSIW